MPGPLESLNKATEKPLHQTYLYEFRTEQCQLFLKHKCNKHRPYTCFYWHFMNQRRRRPVKNEDGSFNYHSDVYCMKYDEATGICSNGDNCPLLHRTSGDTERRYHLRYYKTENCVHETDTKGYCVKNGLHCAFAHGLNDLREPIFGSDEVGLDEFIHNAIPRELLIQGLIHTLKAQTFGHNNQNKSPVSLCDSRALQVSDLSLADEETLSFECLVDMFSEHQLNLAKHANNTSGNSHVNGGGDLPKADADKLFAHKFSTSDLGTGVRRRLLAMLLHSEQLLQSSNSSQALNGQYKVNRLCPTLLLEKDRELQYEDPKWHDGSYVLIHYKTQCCDKPPRLCRQGYACPAYHNDKDRRRSPKIYKYRSTPCPNVKHGDEWGDPNSCENGNECPYCHTRTEQQFHPEIFKTTKCNDMMQTGYCPRGPFCAFAHIDQELCAERKLVCQLMLGLDLNSPNTSPPSLVEGTSVVGYNPLPAKTNSFKLPPTDDINKNADPKYNMLATADSIAAYKMHLNERNPPLKGSFPHDNGLHTYHHFNAKESGGWDKAFTNGNNHQQHNTALDHCYELMGQNLAHFDIGKATSTHPHTTAGSDRFNGHFQSAFRALSSNPKKAGFGSEWQFKPKPYSSNYGGLGHIGEAHTSRPPLLDLRSIPPQMQQQQAAYNKTFYNNINYNGTNGNGNYKMNLARAYSMPQEVGFKMDLNQGGAAPSPWLGGNASKFNPISPHYWLPPPNPSSATTGNNEAANAPVNGPQPSPFAATVAARSKITLTTIDNEGGPGGEDSFNNGSINNGYYSPDLSTFLSLFPPSNESACSKRGEAPHANGWEDGGKGGTYTPSEEQSFKDLVSLSKKLWNGAPPSTSSLPYSIVDASKPIVTRSGSDPCNTKSMVLSEKMSHSAPFPNKMFGGNPVGGDALMMDHEKILNNLPLNLIKCHAEKIRDYLEKVEVALTQKQATTTTRQDHQRCMVCASKPYTQVAIPCGHILLCDACTFKAGPGLQCVHCGNAIAEFKPYTNLLFDPSLLAHTYDGRHHGGKLENTTPSSSLLEGSST